jgi:DNA-binding NtrC family response regulator
MVDCLTRTLLLVDDDSATLTALVGLFDFHLPGITVLTAMSVREAEPLLPRADVVLCDITMPDQPGSALLAAAQRLTRIPPVLMMTGFDDPAVFARLRELGAVTVFTKPLLRDSIIPAIRRVLHIDCSAVSSHTPTDPVVSSVTSSSSFRAISPHTRRFPCDEQDVPLEFTPPP